MTDARRTVVLIGDLEGFSNDRHFAVNKKV